MRIRITFAKTDAMRFTSHLDLQRTLERTIRRANLPLAYSQGYHPHPKLNLASALPLGFTSQCELADFWLKADLPLDEVEAALRRAAAPGMQFLQFSQLEDKGPKLPTLLRSAEYKVTLLDSVPDLDARVSRLLAAASIPRQRTRKGKVRSYDLRPLIEALECLPQDKEGRQVLHMRLAAREGAVGRPDELLAALEVDPHACRVHRVGLLLADPQREGAS